MRRLPLLVLFAVGACRSAPEAPEPAGTVPDWHGTWTREEGSLFHPVTRRVVLEGERFEYVHVDATLGPRSAGGTVERSGRWLELRPDDPTWLPPDFPGRLWVLAWGSCTLLAEERDFPAVANLVNTAGRTARPSRHPFFTRGGLPAADARPVLPEDRRTWIHDEPFEATLVANGAVTGCDSPIGAGRLHFRGHLDRGAADGVYPSMRLLVAGVGDEFRVDAVEEHASTGYYCIDNTEYVPAPAGTRLATR